MYFYTLDENFPIDQLPTYFFDEAGKFVYPETYTPEEIANFPDDYMPQTDTHLEWISTIKGNLQSMFRKRTDVYVAGDIYWYAQKNNPGLRVSPDIMVAFGRPKHPRDSYKQWEEADINPQVVFEIVSKSNSKKELKKKFIFYERYGIEEYYAYDPQKKQFYAWHREQGKLTMQLSMPDVQSPLLGIRLVFDGNTLVIYRPEGTEFLTYVELDEQAEKEREEKLKERKAKEEAEELVKEERKAKEEAEELVKEERKAKEEAEELVKEERKAKKEAEELVKEEQKAKKEAEELVKEERKAKKEAEAEELKVQAEYEKILTLIKKQGFQLE